MKLDIKKMDLDSLDELIGRCEDSMCQPFKKKKAAEQLEQPEAAMSEESSSEEQTDKPDLSDMDMDDLLALYEEMKAKE